MPRSSTQAVMTRNAKAWAEKDLWRPLYSDAYRLALPMRDAYSGGAERGKQVGRRGEQKMDGVFDSTLMVSTNRFANRMQSDLVPPFQKWGKLVPGPRIPDDQKGRAQQELDRIRDAMFAAIFVSNFDTAINEHFLDLAIGTAFLMVLEGDDAQPVRYVCPPQSTVAVEEGPFGSLWAYFRSLKVRVRNIQATWPNHQLRLPDGFEAMKADDPDKEIEFVEATYFDADDGLWYYDVIWKSDLPASGRASDPHRMIEDKFVEGPWIGVRWVKLAGEAHGRGPVLFALPDAKTLNQLKKLVLMNASIAVSGVWIGRDDGVLNPNTVRIVPGVVIPVGSTGGNLGPGLAPLNFGGNFDVSVLIADDLIGSIKQIMLDEALPPDSGPVRSATEIVERIKRLQQDIGSPFGRIMSELIRPLVQKTLNVMVRRGLLRNEGRFVVDGSVIDVQVQSPLAQAQNIADIQNVVDWMQISQAAGQEAMMLGVRIEDVPEWLGRRMGIDEALIRTEEERAQLQQQFASIVAAGQGAGQGGALPANQNSGGALGQAA